jgi:hypothetical protein
MRDYVDYYSRDRVHTYLRDAPLGRKVEIRPSPDTSVVALSRVGGLQYRYTWADAA